jgi:hypothetical protein
MVYSDYACRSGDIMAERAKIAIFAEILNREKHLSLQDTSRYINDFLSPAHITGGLAFPRCGFFAD